MQFEIVIKILIQNQTVTLSINENVMLLLNDDYSLNRFYVVHGNNTKGAI